MPYKRIPINTCRRNEGNRKPPLELHSNNCCRKDSPMNAKISSISELMPIKKLIIMCPDLKLGAIIA